MVEASEKAPARHEHGEDAHGHGANVTVGKVFAIGIGLNVVFVVVEIIYGIAASSVALVADAMHNLSDVLGLILAWPRDATCQASAVGSSEMHRRRPRPERSLFSRSRTRRAHATGRRVRLARSRRSRSTSVSVSAARRGGLPALRPGTGTVRPGAVKIDKGRLFRIRRPILTAYAPLLQTTEAD